MSLQQSSCSKSIPDNMGSSNHRKECSNRTSDFGDPLLEEISRQLNQKISDLQDENVIQRAALNELALINATLVARCRSLELENTGLWNEIFKMKGPTFPNEITDIFIDFLHNNRRTLASCALVCKSWLARSRYHHFSSLSFKESSSTRQTLLRELMIHPLLVSLRLINFDQTTICTTSWDRFWSNKPFLEGIKRVHTQKSKMPLNPMFLSQKLPNLNSLQCAASKDVQVFAPDQGFLHPFTEFLSTRLPDTWKRVTLTLPASTTRFGVKDWFSLQRVGPPDNVQVHLNLCQIREEDLPVLAECFRYLGSSLYLLYIHFLNDTSQVLFHQMNILSRNTGLQHINIFGPFYFDVKRNQYLQSLKNAPGLLASIPGHSLRQITLTFVIGDFSNTTAPVVPLSMQDGLCASIDDILSPAGPSGPDSSPSQSSQVHSRFPCLEEVGFSVYTAKSDYAVQVTSDLISRAESMVQEHFPRLHASGKLICRTNLD
ncbi:hypothetical protein K435DRAFT_839814 [Dendrothele bispora CBS 962.96]|uniref:F-box domain-containing protein n=1 Tax=Dendrothele bispora (strain CBS 962.96) TaxID=1314807 RepID=A0A4S8LZ62_DENBC|nr:hypothetical protein K435DRAFT_839814 [Dendrothele bispora CBS 962.96]